MEVSEVIVALLLPLGVLATWWAYCYERTAYVLVHRPRSDEATPAPVGRPAPAEVPRPGSGQALAPAVAAVGQLERPPAFACTSVLGWDAFTLVATLAVEGRVLLSCRRQSGETAVDGELTMVLLVGDDERADLACALLESWRVGCATLRVRPTAVAGAIEVFDGRHNALRAPLLVA